MKPLGSLISLEEAKSLVAENVLPVEGKENIPIHEVLGRVLAEDVVSVIDIPPYNRAAMDGYAVLASDTFQATKFQPVKLECLEVVHAGQVPTKDKTYIWVDTFARWKIGLNQTPVFVIDIAVTAA